jgi:hypothetical protein
MNFVYIVCWQGYSEEISEQQFEDDLGKRRCWFIVQKSKKRREDIYLVQSQSNQFARVVRSRAARQHEIEFFEKRYDEESFRKSRRQLMSVLKTVVLEYVATLPKKEHPSRLDWQVGIRVPKGHLHFIWQLMHMLVASSNQNDAQLILAFADVFKSFNNPFDFASNPAQVYWFLTAKKGGVARRVNYCNKKAKYTMIRLSAKRNLRRSPLA